MKDFGIKCLIGSEFADIFYNNSFKNGVLPITAEAKALIPLSLLVIAPNTEFAYTTADDSAQAK